ncbi:MAG: DedA family protein [Bdellovibrionia bacterium]
MDKLFNILDQLIDFLLNFYGPIPYLMVFGVLLICGLGAPMPEDIILLAAGLCAYVGIMDLWTAILVSYLGVIIGDSIIFYLGNVYGHKLTSQWFFRKILHEERLKKVQAEYHKKGNRLIFMARFMPGFRAPMYFSAGTLHLPYRVFLFYDGLAALLSVPAIICAVYYFGDQLDHVVKVVKRIEHGILLGIGLGVLAFGARWFFTHRGLKKS